MKKGFTLIEVVIYIALMALLLGAGVTTAFYVVDSSQKTKWETNVQSEGNFILRKIDWALTGASDASFSGTTLTITNNGGPFVFTYDGTQYLLLGASNLNSSAVKIASVTYSVDSTVTPKKFTVSFTGSLIGKPAETVSFTMIKYLRK